MQFLSQNIQGYFLLVSASSIPIVGSSSSKVIEWFASGMWAMLRLATEQGASLPNGNTDMVWVDSLRNLTWFFVCTQNAREADSIFKQALVRELLSRHRGKSCHNRAGTSDPPLKKKKVMVIADRNKTMFPDELEFSEWCNFIAQKMLFSYWKSLFRHGSRPECPQ